MTPYSTAVVAIASTSERLRVQGTIKTFSIIICKFRARVFGDASYTPVGGAHCCCSSATLQLGRIEHVPDPREIGFNRTGVRRWFLQGCLMCVLEAYRLRTEPRAKWCYLRSCGASLNRRRLPYFLSSLDSRYFAVSPHFQSN